MQQPVMIVRTTDDRMQVGVVCKEIDQILSLSAYSLSSQESSKRNTNKTKSTAELPFPTVSALQKNLHTDTNTEQRLLKTIADTAMREIMASVEVHASPTHAWSALDITNSSILCDIMAKCQPKHLSVLLWKTLLKEQGSGAVLIDGCSTSNTAANALARDLHDAVLEATALVTTAVAVLKQLKSIYSQHIASDKFGFKLGITGSYAETHYCGQPSFMIQRCDQYMCNQVLMERANQTSAIQKEYGVWSADAEMAMILHLPQSCKNSRNHIITQLRNKPQDDEEIQIGSQCLDHLWRGVLTLPELLTP